MSLDLVVKILQIGFSGFVFLLAFFSYKLIREEQGRNNEPRPLMLKELKSFRLWAVLLALLVLVSPLLESYVQAKFNVSSVPTISWSYIIPDPNNTNLFQCRANDSNIGTPVDCHSYNSCGVRNRNTTVCRGLFYKDAIELTIRSD